MLFLLLAVLFFELLRTILTTVVPQCHSERIIIPHSAHNKCQTQKITLKHTHNDDDDDDDQGIEAAVTLLKVQKKRKKK